MIGRLPSPLVELDDPVLTDAAVRVWLKRDDLLHPDVPGNKWRKLKYNLSGLDPGTTLLTFGGAYSNHIRATAAAGHLLGFPTIGVIRGEEHDPLNPSLARAVAHGMRLTYLDRGTYRRKTDPAVVQAFRDVWGDFTLIPEGGSNALAVRGCAELPAEIDVPFDVLACPVGTGGTLAGFAAALPPGARALGFAVLKGARYLDAEVARLQAEAGFTPGGFTIDHGFHGGGYARTTPEIDAFVREFEARHEVVLDPVYTAKMLFGLWARIRERAFPPRSRIIAVLTG